MAVGARIRIDEDITSAAKAAAQILSRSTAQQVNHWARIGRELEASKSVSLRDIAQVLRGRTSYDALDVGEQAIVRAAWNTRMTALREGLDLASEVGADGAGWDEADEDRAGGRAPAPDAGGLRDD